MPVIGDPRWRPGFSLRSAALAAVCCACAPAATALAQPAAPTVTSVTPAEGPTADGTAVTIEGSGFTRDATVTVGDKASSVRVESETEITAVTPPESAGRYEVIVKGQGRSSSDGPAYTYLAQSPPTLTSITPAEGPTAGGTAVTIRGSGFLPHATVEIGGRASSVRVESETEITAVTPAESAGRDEVSVTDEYGASSVGPAYTYLAARAPVGSITPVERSTSGGALAGAQLAPSAPDAITAGCSGTQSCDGTPADPFVVGWGKNGHGALGAGYTGWTRGAVSTLASGVRAVAAGMSSYALLDDGTVEAWGDNTFGQLGNGSHRYASLPAPVPGITDAVAVAAGGAHAMALLSNGTVLTWGGNTFGTLGNGTSGKGHEVGEANPVHVPGLSGVVAIAAGGADDVALLSNGTLEAWGENKSGQLGDGTMHEKDVPTPVKGLAGVKAVAMGGDPSIGGHMLVLLQNGTVMAVGGNLAGQLGDGATTDSPTPVPVRGLSGVTSVSADLTHSMALLEDGTIMTWGSNAYGQLGIGAGGQQCPASTCIPVPMAVGLSNVTAISAGFRFSLAVSGGRSFAWGWNQHRELGDGTNTSRATPAPVLETSEVSAIAAGEFHSLALQAGSSPPPALEIAPGTGSLAVRWLAGEEPQRWIVQWRPAGMHARWSPLIYLPSTTRSYTLAGLSAQPYEVLVRNSGFGTRVITGTPLAGGS